MPSAAWPAERTEAFIAMVLAGHPKDELAAKFGISRSAVYARIERLGLRCAPPKPAPEPGPVKLTQAQAYHCRFPIGPENERPKADMLVCGKPVITGQSWCPACAKLVFAGAGAMRAIERLAERVGSDLHTHQQ